MLKTTKHCCEKLEKTWKDCIHGIEDSISFQYLFSQMIHRVTVMPHKISKLFSIEFEEISNSI